VTVPLTLIRIFYEGCSEYKYWYEYCDILHEVHEIHDTSFCSFASSAVSKALMMMIQVSWIVTSSARGFDSVHLEGMCRLHIQKSRAPRRILLEFLDP
jgi:hypothetical protein